MWEFKRVASLNKDPESTQNSLGLTAENHIQEFQDKLFEIYGATKAKETIITKPGAVAQGIEHFILAWFDDKTLKDEFDNPLDIVVHFNGEQEIWEPWLEYLLRKPVMDRNPHTVSFGYVDGTRHHMGTIETKELLSANNTPGYKVWILFS